MYFSFDIYILINSPELHCTPNATENLSAKRLLVCRTGVFAKTFIKFPKNGPVTLKT
jgi:hypothetical protein